MLPTTVLYRDPAKTKCIPHVFITQFIVVYLNTCGTVFNLA